MLLKILGKKLYEGNIGCGIFDLQKAFDTVEHDILLAKLEHLASVIKQINGLNPTSLTENNLFPLIVMYLIKPL